MAAEERIIVQTDAPLLSVLTEKKSMIVSVWNRWFSWKSQCIAIQIEIRTSFGRYEGYDDSKIIVFKINL